jgi:hypothetical protein
MLNQSARSRVRRVKRERCEQGARWADWIPTSSETYIDLILDSGYPKLCCGIRFYHPKQVGLMMKDVPNHFYHHLERAFFVREGIKNQEYKRTPNMYDWLPDYDAFTANFLLQLTKPTTIKRGDPIGIVVPVLLPKQFTLEELKPRG